MKSNIQGRMQKLITPLFIRTLLPIFIFFISLAAAAQTHADKRPATRKEIYAPGVFQQIEVRGNVSVILTTRPAGEILLEGNSKDISRTKASVKNGRLIIDADRKSSFFKLTVYVSVMNVTSMIINGDTEISSSDMIRAEKFEITLNGVSSVAVASAGKVKVITTEGYDLSDGKDLRK